MDIAFYLYRKKIFFISKDIFSFIYVIAFLLQVPKKHYKKNRTTIIIKKW